MAVIEADGLTKTYLTVEKAEGLRAAVAGLFRRRTRAVEAVRDVTFRIDEGETVAFLGPNGAGKTTTLKMLAGLLVPTAGTARVLGFTPGERAVEFRRQIAYVMGQRSQLSWDLPATDSFRLQAAVYAVPRNEYDARVGELVELFGVGGLLRRPLRELSLGERMKMELIAALLPRPRLFLMDEPTLGLDLGSQAVIRDCLRQYAASRRVTTLLTSHYMGDVESLGTRVMVIHGGRLAYDGSLAALKDRYRGTVIVTLSFAGPAPPSPEEWGQVVSSAAGTVVLRMPRPQVAGRLAAIWGRWPVAEVSVREVPLEEVMVEFYRQTESPP